MFLAIQTGVVLASICTLAQVLQMFGLDLIA
jgi:hypothetical protein